MAQCHHAVATECENRKYPSSLKPRKRVESSKEVTNTEDETMEDAESWIDEPPVNASPELTEAPRTPT